MGEGDCHQTDNQSLTPGPRRWKKTDFCKLSSDLHTHYGTHPTIINMIFKISAL